ncbi:MAG: NAD-dependent epimerase/dehydratase family protein [Bacteroidia bacterium]|nr:NAD-dependent epimerase/dehydratase family protein [Bacteroidia bacterium]
MSFQYNILVTGGAGFIGSHLSEALSNAHAKVIILDNLSTGNLNNIQHLQNIEFIEGDINNKKILSQILPQIDYIFHLAALGSVNRSIEDPLSTHLANSTGFLTILQSAIEHGIKGIVYSSSSSVYGDDQHLPKTEENIGKPLSPYAVTKITNELYAYVFWKLYRLPIIGLRYFNVFGPRQNPNGPYAAAIPIFIQNMLNNEPVYIHGTGEQKRDFTYVENIVNANILALMAIIRQKENTFGEVFNVGCQQNISINELFQVLAKKLNYTKHPIYAEPRQGDVFQSLADISKIKNHLHYSPTIFFEEGIDKTIDYFKKNYIQTTTNKI